MNFKSLFRTKRRIVAATIAGVLALGGAGIAVAYFSATGSGTGAGAAGTSTPFTATFATPSTFLFPQESQALSYTLHNPGGGTQHYTITTADYSVVETTNPSFYTLRNTGVTIPNPRYLDVRTIGGTVDPGHFIEGCKASWFTFSNGSHSGTLAHTATSSTLTVTLAMSNGTGGASTQSACETVHPGVHLQFTA